jgi:cytochrome c oxidase subunit 5b
MFLQRSAIAAARRAAISPIVKRSFTSSFVRRKSFRRVLNPESWF